jgi:hypothetical protein
MIHKWNNLSVRYAGLIPSIPIILIELKHIHRNSPTWLIRSSWNFVHCKILIWRCAHLNRISQSIAFYPCYASLALEILRQFSMVWTDRQTGWFLYTPPNYVCGGNNYWLYLMQSRNHDLPHSRSAGKVITSTMQWGCWIYNYLYSQCLSPLTLWVWIPFRRGVLDTTLCDKGKMYF